MRKLILSLLLLLSVSFTAFAQGAPSPSVTLKVNGVEIGSPFILDGTTYVPIGSIAKKMGDKVTWYASSQKAVIDKPNKTVVVVQAKASTAYVNGTYLPLKTKVLNGVVVPVDAKALLKNGLLYIPVDFLSHEKALTYPVKTVTEAGKVVIYVGKQPTGNAGQATPPSTPKPPTQQPSAEGKKYPDGWVAPVLKSSWSSDPQKNRETLQNELGFNENSGFSVKGQPNTIMVFTDYKPAGYEAMIRFSMWGESYGVPEAYRVPVVAKEVFKLYFGDDYMKVYNYFPNKVPDTFTANGRIVKTQFTEADGMLYLKVGFKGKKW